ncbi:hypothetical protein Q8F55_002318 [Vanrija albida]|uniref:Disintegrin domain-containing protein n=1 Tax=Vanrija albida TaxID=181172 RepID=A0ABR3QAG3_9TREE
MSTTLRPSRWTTWSLTLLVAALLFIASASAHTPHQPPVRRVHIPAGSSLRVLPRRTGQGNLATRSFLAPPPHSLRHDDTLLLTAKLPGLINHDVHLLLHPTENLFHPNAKVVFQEGAGNRAEPLLAEDWRVYQGDVIRPSFVKRLWDETAAGIARDASDKNGVLGSASVMVHEVGDNEVIWEGVFTVNGVSYNVLTRENYDFAKSERDVDVDIAEMGDMVVFSDADVFHDAAQLVGGRLPELCSHDNLEFNMDPAHPVRRRDGLLTARDDISSGTDMPDTNYLEFINSTQGCPTQPKALYMGVALDCNYVSKYATTDGARKRVISNWNMISNLYRQTFKISIGITALIVEEPNCPSSAPSDKPWNAPCTTGWTLDARLSIFSQWRGSRGDDGAGLWHLMTACTTDTEIGVAWLGTLCQTDSSQSSLQANQYVSGTGVSTATTNEWTLTSHEIGHNFGAIHDCTNGCTMSSQCCPYNGAECNARGQFIMNPNSQPGEIAFSGCTLGNICNYIGRRNPTCLVDPNSQHVISLQQCGNGIVEPGEDCDPGMNATSACCDPATCKFLPNAKCDPTNSACCTDQCSFASAGTVCRPAVSPECDVAEVCTGTNATCPKDETKPDGDSCGNGLSCAAGVCTSLDLQCKKAGSSMNLTQACGQRGDKTCIVTCKDPRIPNQCTILQTPLLDGSPCGYGGHCYNGTCNAGPWNKVFESLYTQNLQYSIPITVVVGLIILVILWSIFRCVRRCCTRRPEKPMPMTQTRHNGAYPLPQRSSPTTENGEFRAGDPLLVPGAIGAHHSRHVSAAYSDDSGAVGGGPVPAGGYSDPYATGPGGYGNIDSYPASRDSGSHQRRAQSDWVDETAYNGANYGPNEASGYQSQQYGYDNQQQQQQQQQQQDVWHDAHENANQHNQHNPYDQQYQSQQPHSGGYGYAR